MLEIYRELTRDNVQLSNSDLKTLVNNTPGLENKSHRAVKEQKNEVYQQPKQTGEERVWFC